MREEHRQALGIDDSMTVRYIGADHVRRRADDIDVSYWDVFDKAGVLIAKCHVIDAMGMYPPHRRRVTYRKFSALGERLL